MLPILDRYTLISTVDGRTPLDRVPGPDDAPKSAALQSSPAADKAPSAEPASAPSEAPEPAVTAPPVIEPQPEKPTAPAPVQ